MSLMKAFYASSIQLTVEFGAVSSPVNTSDMSVMILNFSSYSRLMSLSFCKSDSNNISNTVLSFDVN